MKSCWTNTLSLCLIAIVIGACGIVPLWVSVTSTVGDVILTTQTGKTSTEHGLSALLGKDCKFIRAMNNRNICVTSEEYEKYLLSLNCETYKWNILGKVSCKVSK